jgi:hypothetical protein
VISNQAYPDLVLQPADPSQSNSPVVLGAAGGTAALPANTWKVSSPLLQDNEVNA